ncbi:hypothetical protein EHV15_34575 [Paenibacillus oralis]|uniref:Uncharacterized protein n=1 Tax=Paenibacillus oralis TaxID=2490856 RepID=A0A3P3T9J4_9BACL|nr:hypothetical protein [Paenibacillus oralis]RRJ54725.1 hypothetical protein EHV15_34575 [Paenibacillus oralis]
MKKSKEILLRKWNPKFLIWMYGIVLILYNVAVTLIFGSNLLGYVATALGSMLIGSLGFQTARSAKRKEKVSLLKILVFAERSLSDIWQVGKYFYYHLRRFRRPILLMVLLYAANAGVAEWALEKWGSSLAKNTQGTILESIRFVYTVASILFFSATISSVLWLFFKVAIRNHLLGAEDKVDSIMCRLKQEGIKTSFVHGQDGRCYLDVKRILNRLANQKETTNSKYELYWDIKNNYNLLLRVEFFPLGKPKTLVQQFADHIQGVKMAQLGKRDQA